MPNASAPNAPWVAVCESPHTIVIPGWVRPSSGPMTWTMPWVSLPKAWIGMPNSAQFASSRSIWSAAWLSTIGRLRMPRMAGGASWSQGVVGVEWSAVATVLSGRRTFAPRVRSPVKAWGLVTSWTRWRSTARTAGAPGSSETTCSSQILSTRVRGWVMVPESVAALSFGRPGPKGPQPSQAASARAYRPEASRERAPSSTTQTRAGPGHGAVPVSAAIASSGWAG